MELYYKKEGKGPALIILHGLFGMLDNWLSIGRSFQEHFTVYLVDQRNHGRSPHSEIFTYKAMSRDLLELMDKENIQEALLLGHSMGGKTAMRLTLDHPQRVQKLVVADISPRKYTNHHQHQGLIDAMLSVNLQQASSRGEVSEMLSGKIMPQHIRQFLMKNLYWKEKDQLAWRPNLEVIRQNLHEVFRGIEAEEASDIPALFLKGEKSAYIKMADEQMIRRLFSRSRIVSIANGSHWLHADNPQDFTREVLNFLLDQ